MRVQHLVREPIVKNGFLHKPEYGIILYNTVENYIYSHPVIKNNPDKRLELAISVVMFSRCSVCVCVCVFCVFIKLRIAAQSGPVILVILCHSH